MLLNMEDSRLRLGTGKPYRKRDRLRFSAWVEPERWHAWPRPG